MRLQENISRIQEVMGLNKKRIHLNFRDLYDRGIIFITECHNLSTGERCEGSNLITLYNIEFPVKGQEYIPEALKHPKPEDIDFWQKTQDQLTQDKYEQILKSIVISEKSNLF